MIRYFLILSFLFSLTIAQGQTNQHNVKYLDTLPDNTVMSLTDPKTLSDSEFYSLDSLHATFSRLKRAKNDQTFRLTLNGKDTTTFFSYTEQFMNWRDSTFSHFNFYLKLNDSIYYRSPDFSYKNCCLEDILAISFTDINSDNYTDIIVLAQFYSGVGSMEQKYAPQYIYNIYYGSKSGLHQDYFLSEGKIKYYYYIEEKKVTIDQIIKEYKSKHK